MTAATMPLRGPLRPRSSVRPLLVTLGVIAAALALWWAVPAVAPPAYGPPPTLSESRMRELRSQISYAWIRGMDVRESSGGVSARLFGGYLEADRIILFLHLAPPGRPSPIEGATLRDQFGRGYRITGSFSDIDTGENILHFEGPGILASLAGLRLTLDVPAVDRGTASERRRVDLSLNATLVTQTEWSGWLGAYATNLAINVAVLAVAGLAYAGLVLGGIRLAVRSRPWLPTLRGGLVSGITFITLALPTYITLGSLARHDPIGPRGLERPLGEYVPWAMAAFFAIESAAIVIAAVSAARSADIRTGSAGSAGRRSILALVAAAMLGFLVLTLPFAELMNACYIGVGFILRPQC